MSMLRAGDDSADRELYAALAKWLAVGRRSQPAND
jgi:hypothetical protein